MGYRVPEYWIVDPEAYTLEQYLLRDSGGYELEDLYEGDEQIVSPRLPCLTLTMNDISAEAKDVLDWA